MKTEKLIELLSDEGKPVKPILNPFFRFAIWLILSLLLILFTLPAVHILFHHSFQLNRDLTGFLILFASTIILGFFAFVMNSPVLLNPYVKILISGLFFIWILRTLFYISFMEDSIPENILTMYSGHPHAGCMANTYLYFTIPFFIIIVMLRTGYTLEKSWAGFYAATASLSIAELMTTSICPHTEALHTLAWHIIPVIPIPVGIWFLSEKIFLKFR